jgi:hypothetical protein
LSGGVRGAEIKTQYPLNSPSGFNFSTLLHALDGHCASISGHIGLRSHGTGHIGDAALRYACSVNGILRYCGLRGLGLIGLKRLLHPGAALKF